MLKFRGIPMRHVAAQPRLFDFVHSWADGKHGGSSSTATTPSILQRAARDGQFGSVGLMGRRPREVLALIPIADDPEVGRWLAALEDGRRETLSELDGVTQQMIDWYPAAPLNSIGTLLYHIALIEAAWVTEEILEVGEPAELADLLPWADREQVGGSGNERHLWRVDGQSLERHIERLASVRAWVLEHLRPMSNEEFHRVRAFERYDAAPDWVLHHILQHEAEHRSHIAWLRDTFAAR